jgi:hypothetical protein
VAAAALFLGAFLRRKQQQHPLAFDEGEDEDEERDRHSAVNALRIDAQNPILRDAVADGVIVSEIISDVDVDDAVSGSGSDWNAAGSFTSFGEVVLLGSCSGCGSGCGSCSGSGSGSGSFTDFLTASMTASMTASISGMMQVIAADGCWMS